MTGVLTIPAEPASEISPADQCRFIGFHKFDDFTTETATNGDIVQLSPVIKAPIAWDQLVASWDVPVMTGALKVEARGIYPDHETRYFTLGVWSFSARRHSLSGQHDVDGNVRTDVLRLRRKGADVQLRLTWSGTKPDLKFFGLSLLDDQAQPEPQPANRAAWGKIITTPERSQHSYPEEEGWCSPTSLSMVLARWSDVLHRPEMNVDVPQVAAAIHDVNFGTGNWPFNTAFAGSFEGMRAYVTRFSDISELEDWIVAGIPVIISAPWHLLQPGRSDTGAGHLTVCIGFTPTGDVVINDPATNLQKGQHVRHIYKRENVINAWSKSKNTVYLVYPVGAKIPADRFGHWDNP
ncbi:MAG TPA: peptidase C39 family protein [Verrucomicrobiae bacterium]|nr:peptidase C39 family protein [Verrucomicrobiae bacterium]